ncbi:MAG: alpha/beta fold hydrolase [Kofleriaceae bacterium]
MDAPPLPAWIARGFPPGMQRELVDVGGIRMHVASWAGAAAARADQPTVVMAHGNPTWSYLWRKVVAALAGSGLRVVVPDLIGLGLSDKPRAVAAHQLSAHATWFGRALDRLVPGRVILVAQDWGGPIGLAAMAARRARLHGLVLANTVIGPPRPGFHPTMFHRLARTPVVSELTFRMLGFPLPVMNLAQGDRRSITGQATLAYAWPLRHLRDRAAPLGLARMVPDGDQHVSITSLRACRALVTSFTGPIELVWGMRDPVLGPVVRYLERELPAARVTLTRAGHFLQEEVPDVLADAIRRVAASPGVA